MKILLASLCFVVAGTSSECDPCQPTSNCPIVVEPPTVCPACEYCCDEWKLFVLGDWLYWKPFAEGYQYILTNQQFDVVLGADPGRVYIDYNTLVLDFDFTSSYRVMGGAYLPSAEKDVMVKFTHVKDTTSGDFESFGNLLSGSTGILGSEAFRVWTLGTDTTLQPGYISASQLIKYDCGDLEFGKIAWNEKPISLRVQAGVRVVNLKNILQIHCEETALNAGYSFSAISDMEIRNQFRGGGLRLGTKADFRLYDRFIWSNEIDCSLVFGKFRMHQSEFYLPAQGQQLATTTAQESTGKLSQYSLKPNFQLATSLGYSFTHYNNEFSLKIGYEIDYWLNMNQLDRFTGIRKNSDAGKFLYVREKGDVFFHGIHVMGGVGF